MFKDTSLDRIELQSMPVGRTPDKNPILCSGHGLGKGRPLSHNQATCAAQAGTEAEYGYWCAYKGLGRAGHNKVA